MQEIQDCISMKEEVKQSSPDLFNLNMGQFRAAIKAGISLPALYLFEKYLKRGFIIASPETSSKIQSFEQELVRKGYMTELRDITELGKVMYQGIIDCRGDLNTVRATEKKRTGAEFDKWWAIFPPHDGFKAGKEFPKSRTLRVDKDTCRKLFEKMVNDGEYKADQIIEATKIDIQVRKDATVRTGNNKLTYLQNSATYLRQKSFDGMIEEIGKRINVQPIGNQGNVVDI